MEFVSSEFSSLIDIAIAHRQTGRCAAAEAIYHQILRQQPHEVIRQCQDAISLYPDYAEAYWMCGVAYAQISAHDERSHIYNKRLI
ncbi:MAG: hypothetical protein HC856_04000 [Pseudanabaena sp. RU_4_16]|nr:hypothetical protein [Pseudanabaena sp. RU_4_16]